jgi:serine/threonine protein kinase
MIRDPCPNRDELLGFLVGRLPDDTSERLARHVTDCEGCRSTLGTLDETSDSVVGRLRGQPVVESYCREAPCREAVARVKSMGPEPSPGKAASASNDELPLKGMLGEYELLEQLGAGGMGHVYKARHVKLNRIVALKTLSQTRLAHADALARFEREMQAVGQLRHPHIVEAYDAREIDGVPFLVMEYVEGATLAQLARRLGLLQVPEACEVVRQAALGLDYAHAHGLIHRDVKPSNLMVTWTGEVKLLDLGLARFAAKDEPHGALTAAGMVMGTADYMAPEQATDSREVDIRVDIYSLGCVLYRLVVGHAPFSGPRHRATFEKLRAHVHEAPPPLDEARPDVPAELQAALDRMLSKDPADRFARPADVAAAMERLTAGCDLKLLLERYRRARSRQAESEEAADRVGRSAPSESNDVKKGEARGQPQGCKRRAARFWVAVVALALVVVGVSFAVVIRIQRGGREMVVRVPDRSHVTVGENGKVEVMPQNGPESRPTATDWERRVAVWALRAGARLHVLTKLGFRAVTHEADLPDEPFRVQVIVFWDTDAVGDSDLEIISRLRELEGLQLQRVPITDRGMPYVARISSLRWVSLSDTKLTPRGLVHLRGLANLENLGLGGLPVSDTVLRELKHFKRLKRLGLGRTDVTDAGLAHLAEIASLRCLELHFTAVTDQGLTLLQHLPHLEVLDLEGTRVSDEGLDALEEIPTLRELNLSGTNASAEGVASLRQALPACKITAAP